MEWDPPVTRRLETVGVSPVTCFPVQDESVPALSSAIPAIRKITSGAVITPVATNQPVQDL